MLSTTSGYIGGTVANPTYEQVSSKRTGHAEAVEVVYDPARVSYRALVDYFWRTIDPTTKDRQFCDVGSPYRTAIFALDGGSCRGRGIAGRVEKTKPFKEPIVTEIKLGRHLLSGRGLSPGLLPEEPAALQLLPRSCGRDPRLKELWGEQAGIERLPAGRPHSLRTLAACLESVRSSIKRLVVRRHRGSGHADRHPACGRSTRCIRPVDQAHSTQRPAGAWHMAAISSRATKRKRRAERRVEAARSRVPEYPAVRPGMLADPRA